MDSGLSARRTRAGEGIRDRAIVATYVVLVLVTTAAWMHVVMTTGGDMAGMEMAMAPTVADGVGYVVAWAIMMAAMMLPSALPMIAFYAATQNVATPTTRTVSITLFVLTYLGLWALTGVPVYAASVVLMMVTADTLAYVVAGVLVVAGLFQLTSLKQRCLRHCRTPLGFLLGHWRAGWTGALTMGAAHAVYCVGCCGALMVVLVVAGAMGLPWVLLVACAVAAEKLLPRGERIARVTGVVLVLLGAIVAMRPALATALRDAGGTM